uniref:Fe2OG dioxygenase domain-containing protein n=1 Tax=Pseudo-nitzschia australis TaxID=44445 RepID=A0A7S4AXE7_9STRA
MSLSNEDDHNGQHGKNNCDANDNRNATRKSGSQRLLNWSMLEDPVILESCRTSLRENGAMVLRDLATPDGLEKLKAEVLSAPYNESKQYYTPWQDQGDLANYAASHPRNFRMHSSAAFVGRKTLEEKTGDRLCVSVYNEKETRCGIEEKKSCGNENSNANYNGNGNETNRLLRFLSFVADKQLYQSVDENGSIYSYRIHSEHNPAWHFDESPYTAILYLENPEGGGEFEYVPWCRPTTSKDDPKGHEIVQRLLMNNDEDKESGGTYSNDDPLVKRIDIEPGSLLFFNGSKSFHRAASITGSTPRVGLVFTFGLSEGFVNSDSVKNSNEWDPRDATCLVNQE